MLRRILLASAGAMALTGVALAQGGTPYEVAPVPEPVERGPVPVTPAFILPPNTPFKWDGLYLGPQIGYAWGNDNAHLFTPEDAAFFFPYHADNLRGVKGGFHFGWNYQARELLCLAYLGYVPWWVLGLEGDVDGSSFGETFVPFPHKHDTIIYSTRANIQGSIRGLSGIAWDRTLIYATGGVAFGSIGNKYDSREFNGLFIDVSRTRVGFTVGGGIKYAFTPNWSFGAEYRFTNFSFTDSSPLTNVKAKHDLNENTVQLKIDYRIDLSGVM